VKDQKHYFYEALYEDGSSTEGIVLVALFAKRKRSREAYDGKMKTKLDGMSTEMIWRELPRLTALTNPYKYAAMRAQALETIKEAVKGAYRAAFSNLIEAGASKEYAQDHARKAADSQEAQMRIRFPDEDTKVYTNKAARNADAFV
jgi:hypothetical protein